ncbi:NAD(P)H-dependent oxidoreductase [Caloramator sp. mosi_1]|uniref:NAD(P)H-dependent oxidoreductase n=1 Tax=Caloramator sp. mosi_1 TaxID=3023090 RepID=UPI00235F2D67|nr:NAD(P)H-dependent oxidoreductase [Caloramator sp. mosi_1]WDC84159.1 NAD(P)H-dependent oxidoreductase [Caloramator sp. mosi_1]
MQSKKLLLWWFYSKGNLPAIEEADAVVFICPNYNDAVSANLSAVINRITALYRRNPFYDKMLFSVIVSGNSGGDSVAKQLIGALNINKGFILPPYFAIMEIANDMGEIKKLKESKIKHRNLHKI